MIFTVIILGTSLLISQLKQNWLKVNAVSVGRNEFQHFVKYFNLVKTEVKQAGFEPGITAPCKNSARADSCTNCDVSNIGLQICMCRLV